MEIYFEALNGTLKYAVKPTEVVYVEDVQGGTQLTTYDHKKLKVKGTPLSVLRMLNRTLEMYYEMGSCNALHAREYGEECCYDRSGRRIPVSYSFNRRSITSANEAA